MTKKNSNNKNNKVAYISRYQKEHCVQVRFLCHKEYDADIIEMLSSVPKKATYLKDLIRQDIARQKTGGNV